MQNIFFPALNDGMTGIIPALAANHDVGFRGQDIDDFAFPFIAPLGADEYRISHRVALESNRRGVGTNASDRCPRTIGGVLPRASFGFGKDKARQEVRNDKEGKGSLVHCYAHNSTSHFNPALDRRLSSLAL